MTEPDVTSIDDLLRHEEDQPAERRRSGAVAWTVKTLFYAAALAGLAVLVLRALEVGVPYGLAFACALGLLVLRRVVADVAAPPVPRARTLGRGEESGEYRWGGGDGLRLAVTRWEIRLDWGRTDLSRFARVMQPALAEIADERLRQRHGLTRQSDPERARELLGEPLWAFLAAPITRSLTPRQFEAIVARLERV